MNQEAYKRPKPAGAPGAPLPTSGENAAASAVGSITIGSKPSVISKEPMRFLVMDAPRQSNLHLYIKECRKQGVTDLVRVCEPTYSGEVDLANAGIQLHELAYPDGTSPPKDVIDRWLELVHQRFFRNTGIRLPILPHQNQCRLIPAQQRQVELTIHLLHLFLRGL